MDVQEFKNLVVTKNIRFIPHHPCGICGCYPGYSLNILPGNEVTAEYSRACDCGWSPDRRVSLEDVAEWFDHMSEYERNAVFVNFCGG